MARPIKRRNVSFDPKVTHFVPSGVPRCRLETVIFGTDEIEALRLTDLEGLYQDQAAEVMGISRQTLGRILASARRKASEALTGGKEIRIRTGEIDVPTPGCAGDSSGCSRGSLQNCGREQDSGCGHSRHGESGEDSGKTEGCGSGKGCGHSC